MIFCKELNQDFATKGEMFAELKKNRDKIVGLKKAAIKNSDWVMLFPKKEGATKADTPTTVGIGSTIYPIINTTNFFDSCGDVHINGLWDISIKDNKGKLYYIINHDLEIGKVIAYPNDVDASVQLMDWSMLGLTYSGSTQALVYKVLLTEASNKDALNAIINKAPLQNSVRMQYIEMTLCVDSTDEDMAQEFANFHKYLPDIANKQDAIDAGYFWAITQAKIVKEGSACLYGANSATPILYTDPANTSQKNDPDPSDDNLDEDGPEIEDCTVFDMGKLLTIF